jgi:chromate reductase
MSKKIVAISGSLRVESYNTKLLKAFQILSPREVSFEILNISNLPLFNEDIEKNFPQEAWDLKKKIEGADAVIFASPEYNRGITSALKNAVDWASRPWGNNSFAGKVVAVTGASVGPIATAISQQDLKKIMLYLDANVVGQPEFFLGSVQDKFDEKGSLVDEKTKGHIKDLLEVIVSRIK